MITEPLHLLDCDYPINGACAAILTTGERARDLAKAPVYVDAMAYGTGSNPDWVYADDFMFGGTIPAAKRMWATSSLTPADVDIAEIYDGFTHITISWIEALGLCGIGEFGDWVDDGRTIGPGGSLPLNTHGGQLAEGRMHGLAFLTEAVLQLRGECGVRQVPERQGGRGGQRPRPPGRLHGPARDRLRIRSLSRRPPSMWSPRQRTNVTDASRAQPDQPRQRRNVGPSKVSRVAKSSTGSRRSLVSSRTGLPRGRTVATAKPSGMCRSSRRRGSWRTSTEVMWPP